MADGSTLGLACEVWLPKSRIAPGESIPLRVALVNRGESGITLYGHWRVGFDIDAYLRMPGGDERRLAMLVDYGERSVTVRDFVTLSPGQIWGVAEDVPPMLFFLAPGRNDIDPEARLPVGQYAGRVKLSIGYTGEEFGLRAWTGRILSNEAHFEVVADAPEGSAA